MNQRTAMCATLVAVLGIGAWWLGEGMPLWASSGPVTYANATFDFSVQLPRGFSAYPPDSATVPDSSGGAIVFTNSSGQTVQVEVTPYATTSNDLTLADLEQLQPATPYFNTQPISVGSDTTGMAYEELDGAFGDTAAVAAFHGGYLYELSTSEALKALFDSMLATWRFSN
jgi:hypothetical protein